MAAGAPSVAANAAVNPWVAHLRKFRRLEGAGAAGKSWWGCMAKRPKAEGGQVRTIILGVGRGRKRLRVMRPRVGKQLESWWKICSLGALFRQLRAVQRPLSTYEAA